MAAAGTEGARAGLLFSRAAARGRLLSDSDNCASLTQVPVDSEGTMKRQWKE